MCEALGGVQEIEALARLLSHEPDHVDQDKGKKKGDSLNPGTLFPSEELPGVPVKPPTGRVGNEIWSEEEVLAQEADPHKTEPRYSFLLKQTVGTEDAYLGLGNKDPSSNSCEDLVLKVELPGVDSLTDIRVDLERRKAFVSTPLHELRVCLPHEVDENKSKAAWDPAKKELTLTLRRRDLPFNGL